MAQEEWVMPEMIAAVYTALDDKDHAFLWLEQGFQQRSVAIANLKTLPVLAPLHSDARYADLVHRMHLDAQ